MYIDGAVICISAPISTDVNIICESASCILLQLLDKIKAHMLSVSAV